MEKITIKGEYLKLEQLLKIVDLVSSGGEAKFFLINNKILVNNEEENRRGRKLYKGDVVKILGKTYELC